MPVKTSEALYMERPVLVIEWDGREPDRRPFRLGLGNAKRVLEATEQIRAFVATHKNAPKYPTTKAREALP